MRPWVVGLRDGAGLVSRSRVAVEAEAVAVRS